MRRRQAAHGADFFQRLEERIIIPQSFIGGRLNRCGNKNGSGFYGPAQGLFDEGAERFPLLACLIFGRLQHRIVNVHRCLHA